jgi:hypothetical protein
MENIFASYVMENFFFTSYVMENIYTSYAMEKNKLRYGEIL